MEIWANPINALSSGTSFAAWPEFWNNVIYIELSFDVPSLKMLLRKKVYQWKCYSPQLPGTVYEFLQVCSNHDDILAVNQSCTN